MCVEKTESKVVEVGQSRSDTKQTSCPPAAGAMVDGQTMDGLYILSLTSWQELDYQHVRDLKPPSPDGARNRVLEVEEIQGK